VQVTSVSKRVLPLVFKVPAEAIEIRLTQQVPQEAKRCVPEPGRRFRRMDAIDSSSHVVDGRRS
jgi:hypothetical protein